MLFLERKQHLKYLKDVFHDRVVTKTINMYMYRLYQIKCNVLGVTRGSHDTRNVQENIFLTFNFNEAYSSY